MKKPENISERILYLFLVYTLGTFLDSMFYSLRLIRTVRILHKERILHGPGPFLVLCNHPALIEVILIPLLFFWNCVLHPFKLCPISIPDIDNYYKKWYWWWLRFYAIPIDRKNKNQRRKAFFEMKKVLNDGGILILFPEGGRTCFGTEFLYSLKGKRIRILKGGVGQLISETNPAVLFIWVDGAEDVLPNSPDRNKLYQTLPRLWKQMTIKPGRPLCFLKELNPEVIVQEVAAMLLQLADEDK